MPQNRPQYTFGQLVSLVEELRSSVNNLKSDFDKIQESNNRLERRLTKAENNSNENEAKQDHSSNKKLKREEIKREILDYKEDISCDHIEPADIQKDLLSLETESEAPHLSHPKPESNPENHQRKKRRNKSKWKSRTAKRTAGRITSGSTCTKEDEEKGEDPSAKIQRQRWS